MHDWQEKKAVMYRKRVNRCKTGKKRRRSSIERRLIDARLVRKEGSHV
jgi:hypothetical protein